MQDNYQGYIDYIREVALKVNPDEFLDDLKVLIKDSFERRSKLHVIFVSLFEEYNTSYEWRKRK